MGGSALSRSLSTELLTEVLSQESTDPFLTLVTISHVSLGANIYLVNNTEDIVSNGNTFSAFPMKITLPIDDGERTQTFSLELDNVSLELIDELRNITVPLDAKFELILASNPDVAQITYDNLKVQSAGYDASSIQLSLYVDAFLNTELSSETYSPASYPGIF